MKKKVFIGVGHGGSDPGACANGLQEAQVNLIQAKAMRDVLVRHDVEVRLSRETDEDDRLAEEIRECNAYAPDLAVECHNNAGGGDGFEVYYWPGSERSRTLAQCMEREVLKIGQNSRGVKSSTSLGWVRQVKAPCVLCEGFFLDSADHKIADTEEKQKAFGVAYAKGVLSYWGIPYQEQEDKTMQTIYETIRDVPDWARACVSELMQKGYLKGDGDGRLDLEHYMLRGLVINWRAGMYR